MGAEGHDAASLRLELDGNPEGFVVRDANGPLQDRIDRPAESARLVGKRMPLVEVGGGAERRLDQLEGKASLLRDSGQHLSRLAHGFGANAISR